MSLSTIRAQIKVELESISSVGKVQDYQRRHIDWDKIVNDFVNNGRVNAWIIEVRNATNEKVASGSIANARVWFFRLFGLYSLKDLTASKKTFAEIVEEVMDEFCAIDKLENTKARTQEQPQWVSNDNGMFAGILCHRAEVIVSFKELLAYS